MHDVFISYSRSDESRVRRFAEWLQAQGWSVRWDQTIPPGHKWDDAIARWLAEASCVIVLWSHDSVQSDWVKTEAAEANRRKVLIPVLIDHVEIPLEFRRVQSLDLSNWNFRDETPETALLRQAISPFLDPERPPAPPSLSKRPRRRRWFVAAGLAGAVALAIVLAPSIVDRWRKPASELVTLSDSLRTQVLKKDDESSLYWPYMLDREGGQAFLEQSGLLAVEAVRRDAGLPGAREALRKVSPLLDRPVREFAHDEQVKSVAISPDGKLLATASRDATAGIWEIGGRPLFRLRHGDEVQNVVFSPDGKALATASRDGTARIWDVSSGRQIVALAHPTSGSFGVQHILFTGDGTRLITLENRTAHVWSVPDGRELHAFEHPYHVGEAAVSRDGAYLVTAGTGSNDAPATVWEIASGRQVALMRPTEGGVIRGIATGPEILAIAQSNLVSFWRTGAWTRVGELRIKAAPSAAAISPDGSAIAIGGGSARYGPVVVGPVGEGESVARILSQRKNAGVYGIRYSADGKLLAAIAQDQTLQILDARTGEDRLRVRTGPDVHLSPNPVAFSPDGLFVAAAGSNRARLWQVVPRDLLAEACRRIGRNLTQDEWRQWLGREPYRKTCPDPP